MSLAVPITASLGVRAIEVGRHGTTQLAEFLGVFLKLRVAEPGPHLLSRGLVLKAAKRTVTSSAYCCATGGTLTVNLFDLYRMATSEKVTLPVLSEETAKNN